MDGSESGARAFAPSSLWRALAVRYQIINAEEGGISLSTGRAAFPTLIALVAVLGAAHILVRTSTYGAALGNDAFNYISAAESLAAGEGLLGPGGGQMALFAPFFSMAMAFLSLFGIEPVDGGRLLNAAAFGLLILASGLWLSRRLKSRLIALGVAVAMMTAVPLAHAASTLLSEPLFILFTVLALMPLESFLNRRSGRSMLTLSAVFAALAALTRYIGVVLIFSAVLMLVLRRDIPIRERLKDALLFGAISSLPLAAALTRNQLVSGTLTGDRSAASGQPLFDSLRQIVEVFQQWADPLSLVHYSLVHYQLQHSPWLVACLLLLLAAVLFITPRPGRASSVFWVFALIYLAIIAVVVGLASWQGIDSRFLLPIYVPLLFVAAFWLDALVRGTASGRMSVFRWALAALVLIGCCWHIGVSARQNLRLTATALESGYTGNSFNTAYWEDSELVEYVRANPVSGRYYSNVPNALRWNAGIPGTLVTLVPTPRQGVGDVYDCQRWFERAVLRSQEFGEAEEYVVWVGQGEERQIICDILDMESPLPLEPVAELADGAIFRVNEAFDSARARQSALEARASAYESLVSGEPVIRSEFDIYLIDDTLVYVREPCVRADAEASFLLHLIPADADDLPPERKRYGFSNLDFDFQERGIAFDGKCMVRIALPEYDITHLSTGQYVQTGGGFENIWKEEIRLER